MRFGRVIPAAVKAGAEGICVWRNLGFKQADAVSRGALKEIHIIKL